MLDNLRRNDTGIFFNPFDDKSLAREKSIYIQIVQRLKIKMTVTRVSRTKRSSDRVTVILIFYLCTICVSALHVYVSSTPEIL